MNKKNPSTDSKHKTNNKIVILAISLSLIGMVVLFIRFLYPALLLGGFFDNPPKKSEVMQMVNENASTFEDAMEYIKTLDTDTFGIEYEDKHLFLENRSHVDIPISNEALEDVFNLGVKSIYVGNNYVEFYCGGAGREYGTGVIYSEGNVSPVGLEDELSMTLTKEGDGWVWEEEGGDNHYYRENIKDNWYYYQMWW